MSAEHQSENASPGLIESESNQVFPTDHAELEEWVDELLKADPEIAELRHQRNEAKRNGDQNRADEFQHEIGNRWQTTLTENALKFGITLEQSEDADSSDMRQKQATLKAALAEAETDPEDALKQLGMINDEGQFTYPDNLFSPRTNRQWQDYIVFVQEQEKAFEMARSHELTLTAVEMKAIDSRRVRMHDEFTNNMMVEFGLEVNQENFDAMRSIAAKMRDKRLPNTGEVKIAVSKVYNMIDAIDREISKEQAA